MNQARKILVTGASGYVGGRLVTNLLANNFQVRVLVRDAQKAKAHAWADQVEIATGNANDFAAISKAMQGIHTVFYLLHSINAGPNFDEIEAKMARNFATAAAAQNVAQLVYLGGIANDKKQSQQIGRAHV